MRSNHYEKLAIQPLDVMAQWLSAEAYMGFLRGNVLKYLMRDKGCDIEDIDKAIDYLQRYKAQLENTK